MIESRTYLLPITGRMASWATLSGDPADPLRAAGPHELARTWSWPDGVDRTVAVELLEVDPDAGTGAVRVTADAAFLDALALVLATRTPAQAAEAFGVAHRKRPSGSPRPPARLLVMQRREDLEVKDADLES